MAKLITVYWRDIPSHLIARSGRKTTKHQLPGRFQRAIHRAAMRAGKGGSEAYIDDWRRVASVCDDDVANEMQLAAEQIEAGYDDAALELLAKRKGHKPDA